MFPHCAGMRYTTCQILARLASAVKFLLKVFKYCHFEIHPVEALKRGVKSNIVGWAVIDNSYKVTVKLWTTAIEGSFDDLFTIMECVISRMHAFDRDYKQNIPD